MHPNDPRLSSFIPVDADSDFPIQNLPFGIFSTHAHPNKRVGVAIGEFVLDLAVIEAADLLRVQVNAVFNQPTLNSFIALGQPVWEEARKKISELLRADQPRLRDDAALHAKALIPMHEVQMHMPIQVSGYTDFYSSR